MSNRYSFYWKVIPDGTERSLRRSPSRPRIQHKAILLDELKSAREQQKRRDERADGSVPLKLSGKIHKQLESIARSRGVLPKKLLNEMIEQAYHDLVATWQNSQIDSR